MEENADVIIFNCGVRLSESTSMLSVVSVEDDGDEDRTIGEDEAEEEEDDAAVVFCRREPPPRARGDDDGDGETTAGGVHALADQDCRARPAMGTPAIRKGAPAFILIFFSVICTGKGTPLVMTNFMGGTGSVRMMES